VIDYLAHNVIVMELSSERLFLVNLDKGVGVAVALIGTIVVAPDGTILAVTRSYG
jgi:hypothetical protein